MNRKLITLVILLAIAILASACVRARTPGDPTPTTRPASTPANPTQPANPNPTPGSVANCSDNQTTNLSPRDPAKIGDAVINIQFRDPNCVRAVYHVETGVAKGQNFSLSLPKGWSLAVSAVSVQVAPNGGKPTDYTGGPFLVIRGPWSGSIGVYEAGLHLVPSEWENAVLIQQILPVHRNETKKPNDQPIYIGG